MARIHEPFESSNHLLPEGSDSVDVGSLWYRFRNIFAKAITVDTVNYVTLNPPIAVPALPLSVANGGTGDATLTSGNYLKGAGTSPVTFQAAPIPAADGGTGITQVLPFTSGRFTVLGSSTPFSGVHITPYNGNQMTVNGALRTIPTGVASVSGGVQATNFSSCFVNKVAAQTLSNSTLYYVYLFWDGSALQIDFSTTGRAADSNGIWVKSGDTSCTLIGLVWINGTKTIDGSANKQNAVSWLNKIRIPLSVTLSTSTFTNSVSYAEVDATKILEWVQFNDDTFAVSATFVLTNNGVQLTYGAIGINSTTVFSGVEGQFTTAVATYSGTVTASTCTGASGSEGHVIAHFLNKVSGGTGNLNSGQMYTQESMGS